MLYLKRDQSLITGKGGVYNIGGGTSKVLPLRKAGTEKVLVMLKGFGGGCGTGLWVIFPGKF